MTGFAKLITKIILRYYCSKRFYVYFDLFLVIYVDCKCCLQCVNYFLCSFHNILLLNTFSKFSWQLACCCKEAFLIYDAKAFHDHLHEFMLIFIRTRVIFLWIYFLSSNAILLRIIFFTWNKDRDFPLKLVANCLCYCTFIFIYIYSNPK
jgi:hypothetical protein